MTGQVAEVDIQASFWRMLSTPKGFDLSPCICPLAFDLQTEQIVSFQCACVF